MGRKTKGTVLRLGDLKAGAKYQYIAPIKEGGHGVVVGEGRHRKGDAKAIIVQWEDRAGSRSGPYPAHPDALVTEV